MYIYVCQINKLNKRYVSLYLPKEEHMQNKQFLQVSVTVCDLKQHPQTHLPKKNSIPHFYSYFKIPSKEFYGSFPK